VMSLLPQINAKRFLGSEKILAFLFLAGFVSLVLTFFSFADRALTPYTDIFISFDVAILSLIIILLIRKIYIFIKVQRKTSHTSRLHTRLAILFSLISLLPAIFMALFSLFFFHVGVQSWFSDQIKTAIVESQEIATSYLHEHQSTIRADILAMAKDLDMQAEILSYNSDALEKAVNRQAFIRNLSEAIVFDGEGRVSARSSLTFTLAPSSIPEFALRDADDGDVVVFPSLEDDRVRGLVKLQRYPNSYLTVGRLVDPVVLSRIDQTRDAAARYEQLEKQSSGLRNTLTLIYIVFSVFLTGVAVWLGLNLARSLVRPIERLVIASEQVRAGDLNVYVDEKTGLNEFDLLARSFNRMTGQIQSQHKDLIQANRQMDERRRFTETVLSGVSSGVLSLDKEYKILLTNAAAAQLLERTEKELMGQYLEKLVPALKNILEDASKSKIPTLGTDIPYIGPHGKKLDLLVKIVPEVGKDGDVSYVITFDDISALKSAQRKAAWSDVARRIAHEIKNPLTPIQLSAERIKRRFSDNIPEEHREVFEKCIQTIGKHVEDINHMVTEFSAFARMPQPSLKLENIKTVIRDVIILQSEAHENVSFHQGGYLGNTTAVKVLSDTGLLRQALTNLVQNAIDAMDNSARKELYIWLIERENEAVLVIADTGKGFPEDVETERLTDPYVTHKEKGTGLGLAIVKKIMEEHNGSLRLGRQKWMGRDLDEWEESKYGAVVALHFPLDNNR